MTSNERRPVRHLALLACVSLILVTLLGGNLYAGEKHEKCGTDSQKCLDKMAAKMAKKGWLGIETEKIDGGWYRIAAVHADSPAAQAGLQSGDVLLAINGVKVNAKNKAELKKAKKALTAGATASYVVKRNGTKQQVAVTLGTIPKVQLAEWVGQHMIEHHLSEEIATIY